MCKFHVDEPTKSIYNMIFSRDLIFDLGAHIGIYVCTIVGGEGPYNECTAPMMNLNSYGFNMCNRKGQIHPK